MSTPHQHHVNATLMPSRLLSSYWSSSSLTKLSNYTYYTHTEKYSPKSYVVNFCAQISSSQSEERTIVFTREKNDTSNQNRERCFFTCEKNDTSNQKPQRCVSFAPKFPPFIAACSAASHTFNEKSFTQRVFLAKKVKNIPEMEWNSFICFTVDEENGRELAKQQRKGKNRNLTCSLRSLTRFLIRQQLLRKYRTPALSKKYSLFNLIKIPELLSQKL